MVLRRLSENLTDSKYIPWRFRHLGGPLNTLIAAPLRKAKLYRLIEKKYATKPHDITLIIGIKQRINYRLENTLRSVKLQTYPQGLIKVLIVDYDNNESESTRLRELCAKYDAQVVRVENCEIWNKSHCLNVAIKQTATKYLMPIDADIILSPKFVEEVIETLKREPLSMVLSEMLDLPEDLVPELEVQSKTGLTPETVAGLKNKTKTRKTHTQLPECENIHISLHATYTFFYHMIGGYDEYYSRWGSEDNDMFRRLCYFGLTPRSIQDTAFYMHQWHPKHESLPTAGLQETIRNNHLYFNRNHSIIRNDDSWGFNGRASAHRK